MDQGNPEPARDGDLNHLRAGWLDDDLFIASSVGGEDYAPEIAEDFF